MSEYKFLENAKEQFTFDTEFIEDGKTLDLISIGIVNLNTGKTLYYISAEFNAEKASDWVKENVLAKLDPDEPRYTKQFIKNEVINFCGSAPEFWAYYASYDWIAMCQLFGTMMDLPKHFPMICFDIKQEILRQQIDVKTLPADPTNAHNALDDALWNASIMSVLFTTKFKRAKPIRENKEEPIEAPVTLFSPVVTKKQAEDLSNDLEFLTRHHD